MTKKRRMFEIELPEDAVASMPDSAAEIPTDHAPARRGPMATAISETAEAGRERAAIEADIRAENDALAHEFVRLRRMGMVTDLIPLDRISAKKLFRDRNTRVEVDVSDLKTSLQTVGLSNPIRVEADAHGNYELVEGWRRMTAYRQLLDETGDDHWSLVPATYIPLGETVKDLYRRMVDENLVRKEVSWSEMAALARAYSDLRVGGCANVDEAVNELFASANPQKRSYIRRFAQLLNHLEVHLQYPHAIPRALGLSLSARLDNEPELARRVIAAIRMEPDRTAEAELRILQSFDTLPDQPISPRGNPGPDKPGRGRPARHGKTVLRLPIKGGEVKCTALPGKVELVLNRDFSIVDRIRLERAIEAFFDVLG
jgi:ParB family chromosome partitioning protein